MSEQQTISDNSKELEANGFDVKVEHFLILAFANDGMCYEVSRPQLVTESEFNEVLKVTLGAIGIPRGSINLGNKHNEIKWVGYGKSSKTVEQTIGKEKEVGAPK